MDDLSYMGGMPTLTQAMYTNADGDFGSAIQQYNRSLYGTDWGDLSAASRQNVFNMWLADYNNQYNARQAELAYQRQRELIQAENEYNSPVNQMARYAEAGLNPNVIYSQIQPGQQTQIAKYEPQRSSEFSAVGDPRGTKEQKLEQAMTVLGMVGNMVKQFTGMAQDVEGVRNTSLHNDLLAAQLPFEKALAYFRRGALTANYDDGSAPEGGKVLDWNSMFDLAFPKLGSSSLSGARAKWQEWYNKNIAEPFKQIMIGRGNLLESQTGKSDYDLEMLNSIPENVRGIVYFLLQILNGVNKSF